MDNWEIVCWGVVIIFVVFGLLGIFAVVNSGQISREQAQFERVAWIKHYLKELDKNNG